ncbi:MAG: hypothetical protein ISR47_00200 [Rhodospirillales bacterium]|nr:hypothetical protein [Rhodospirillales bacterium]
MINLRYRLLLAFMGLAVGPILIVGFVSGRTSFVALEKQNKEILQATARRVNDNIVSFFHDAMRDVRFLEKDEGFVNPDKEKQYALLSGLILGSRNYQEICLIGIDRNLIAHASRTDVATGKSLLLDWPSSEEIRFIKNKRQGILGEVYFAESIREPIVPMATPLINPRTGQVSHVLIMSLRFKPIWNLLAGLNLKNGRDAYVVDRNGRVVAHRNPTMVLRNTQIDTNTDSPTTGLFGEEVVTAIHEVPFDNAKLMVVIEQPISNANAITNKVLWTVFFVSLLAIVGALGFLGYFDNTVVRPLQNLAKFARGYSHGNHSREILPIGVGEVRDLSIAFNQMVDRIGLQFAKQEVLLKEIHHRVKNNLQVVSSMLSLQARDEDDAGVRTALQESQRRVRVMARVHESLYLSDDLAVVPMSKYLESIIDDSLKGTSGIALELEADDTAIGIDQAIPCGQIISELVSNSLKHAFPNTQSGNIKVSVFRTDEGPITLIVADDGAGLPGDFDLGQSETLGMKLVHSLAMQLSAAVEIDSSSGTRVKVTFQEK